MTLVAFGVPVIIGGLAMAIDTGIWYLEKRKVQQAADGASLGAMRTIRNGGTLATAQNVALSDAQRNGYIVEAGASLVVNSPPTSGPYAGQSNAVEVVITRQLPTYFSRYFLASANSITARSVSYTGTTLGKNVEVSMMLDVSSSMSGNTEVYGLTKLAAMKDAAKQLVDIVIQPTQIPYSSRIALVPYSSAVNVGTTYYSAVTGQAPVGTWNSVVERGGTTAFTDDAPGATQWLREFRTRKAYAMGPYASWVQNVNYNVPAATSAIKPLSTDKNALKSTIDTFTASGTTAGHIGTAWAWYAVSPNWSTVFSGIAAPNGYNPAATHKVVVLLSDFDMNSYYQSANGNSATQTRTLCTNMKAAGVVVYTIGYGVNPSDSTAVNLWQDCATDSTKVFSASTVAEMTAAFRAIGTAAVGGAMTSDIRLGE